MLLNKDVSVTFLFIILLEKQKGFRSHSQSTSSGDGAHIYAACTSVRATRSIPHAARRDAARVQNFIATFIDSEATNSYIIHSEPG